jgi:hypothetical protein
VESCGLPDRIHKILGTKIMALLTLFVKQVKKKNISTFFPLFLVKFDQKNPKN